MYPDYEEDKKELKGAVSDKELKFLKKTKIKNPNKKMMGGSVNKYKSGSYVTVKTKLGRNKKTKIC